MNLSVITLRLRDRAYLATTAFIYALMAVLFLTIPFGVATAYPMVLVLDVPRHVWGVMFLVGALLSATGTFRKAVTWQKVALAVCAGIAGGMCAIFAWKVAAGIVAALIPTIVWGYMCLTHFIMLKYHDPHTITMIQNDVAKIQSEIETIQNRPNY